MAKLNYAVAPGGLSKADHDLITFYAERGWSAKRIAEKIAKHPSTVLWFMYQSGLQAPKQRDEGRSYFRNGREVRTFSSAEDAFISQLRAEGLGFEEIARRVSAEFGYERVAHSIHNRLVMLANLDEVA